jgi:hypothetical protein
MMHRHMLYRTPLKSSLLRSFNRGSFHVSLKGCFSMTCGVLLLLAGISLSGCLNQAGSLASPLTAHPKKGLHVADSTLDDTDRRSLEKQSPRTVKKIDNGESLTTDDIKKMARAGLSDDVIMQQIDATKSTFYLSSADIVDMKKAGISQRVISYMVQTGNQ